MHLDVRHRHIWQIQLKRLPVAAVIERDEDAEFRSREEQSFAIGILANYSRGPIRRNAVPSVRQTRPGRPELVSPINVWLLIAEPTTIHGLLRRPLRMRRCLAVL